MGMRIGLGCMRLSTEQERDEARSIATLHAALDAGMVVFDTAHAYGQNEADCGHNEELIGRVVREHASSPTPRIVTKCGMRRDGGAWIPDGRANRIAADVAASLEALGGPGGPPIDTLLLHAPDPRTSLATTARALVRAAEKGGIARVGVSNVSRKQLEELSQHAPVAAVEVALGAYDDLAVRSGVVAYCLAHGIEVLAHAPLGGQKRAQRLARDQQLGNVAAAHPGATAIEVFLAYLLTLPPAIVPIVGARRPETIASIASASQLVLSRDELAAIDARFPVLATVRAPRERARGATTSTSAAITPTSTSTSTTITSGGASAREIVIMMGVPGAGKSTAAEALVARGYARLNRDTLGGTLRGIVRRLDDRLREGAERVVLDNTYVTRATRSDVLRVASAYDIPVRCVFFDTTPPEAQINIVLRMIHRFGAVLEPAEISRRSREDPAALGPLALLRMTRDLELPAEDEGFATIEVVPFVRGGDASLPRERSALAISLDGRDTLDAELTRIVSETASETRCLLYAWRPDAEDSTHERLNALADELAASTGRAVEHALCTHPAGPPTCWCRPPLPGLWVAFAHRHGIDVRDVVHWRRPRL